MKSGGVESKRLQTVLKPCSGNITVSILNSELRWLKEEKLHAFISPSIYCSGFFSVAFNYQLFFLIKSSIFYYSSWTHLTAYELLKIIFLYLGRKNSCLIPAYDTVPFKQLTSRSCINSITMYKSAGTLSRVYWMVLQSWITSGKLNFISIKIKVLLNSSILEKKLMKQ